MYKTPSLIIEMIHTFLRQSNQMEIEQKDYERQ